MALRLWFLMTVAAAGCSKPQPSSPFDEGLGPSAYEALGVFDGRVSRGEFVRALAILDPRAGYPRHPSMNIGGCTEGQERRTHQLLSAGSA